MKKNQKPNATKTEPNSASVSAAIHMAIDRVYLQYRKECTFQRLHIQHNPAADKAKITPYEDCEDGMYASKMRIP